MSSIINNNSILLPLFQQLDGVSRYEQFTRHEKDEIKLNYRCFKNRITCMYRLVKSIPPNHSFPKNEYLSSHQNHKGIQQEMGLCQERLIQVVMVMSSIEVLLLLLSDASVIVVFNTVLQI